MFENPSRGMQANNVTTNVPKILVLKSSSEQIFSESCRWVPLQIVQSKLQAALRNDNVDTAAKLFSETPKHVKKPA